MNFSEAIMSYIFFGLIIMLLMYGWATFSTLRATKRIEQIKMEILKLVKQIDEKITEINARYQVLMELTTKIGPLQKVQIEMLQSVVGIYRELIEKGIIVIPQSDHQTVISEIAEEVLRKSNLNISK